MPRATQFDITTKGDAQGETTPGRARTRGSDMAPPPPGDISNGNLLAALHQVSDTGPAGGRLFAEDAEAGAAFVRKLLAGRRPSDLRGAKRVAVYAAARGFQHPGAGA